MDLYINQLINDIEHIINQKPSTSDVWDDIDANSNAGFEANENAEQYLYGQKHELQHIVGIAKEALPPLQRMTDKQISRLLPSLIDLLEYHHYEISFPRKIDDRTKYELLYREWDKKQVKINRGFIGIEFCHYDEEHCPIPGKCNMCAETRQEYENAGNNLSNEDLLFNNPHSGTTIEEKTEKVKHVIEHLKPAKENITGIFNYCNRWCEKCSFTNRCTNYQFEEELGFYNKNVDKDEMLQDVGAILSGTLSFLKSKIEEMDIDFSDYSDEVDDYEFNQAHNHPLAVQARDYMTSVSKWLEGNFNYFSDVASKVWNISQKNYRTFDDQLETIGWHMTMIPVKMVRALNPKDKYDDDEFHAYDSNGTGKLVLECIDKSIAAFSFLFPKLSKKQDEILSFLSTLSQLKAKLEVELPDAKNFVRPGLDE